MAKPCSICSLPQKRRAAVDLSLVEGRTYSWIAQKYSRPGQTVSRSSVARHALHALKAPEAGLRLRGGRMLTVPPATLPPPPEAGKTLLQRVEGLLLEFRAIAEQAKTERQLTSAVSALREIRCSLELMAKLDGTLATASVNFFNIELTKERALEFLLAAQRTGPDLTNFICKEVGQRYGFAPPPVEIHFITPEPRDMDGTPLPPGTEPRALPPREQHQGPAV